MTDINDCNVCDSSAFEQCVFLGCSIKGVQGTLGFGPQPTELTVELIEDSCAGPKYCYNECCERVELNEPDMGFFGEKRWKRADDTQYTKCLAENVGDTLFRDAINIVGGPVFFRLDRDLLADPVKCFEFSGIVSDWIRTENNGIVTYQVKIVDPRIILQGVQLIIGDYAGRIDQVVSTGLGGTGCPTINLFNVFGFMEQFGVLCPPWAQCYPGQYDSAADHYETYLTTCPGLGLDGEVFGTWIGGFGGSYWNESGMTLRSIVDGFNVLANNETPINNIFSPYGRVAYASYIIPAALVGKAAGLIQDDDAGTECRADKFFYYVDLSDIPIFNDFYYRVSGTSISLLDLLQKLADDFNFDFYVTLLPTRTGDDPCINKFIKVHVIYRQFQTAIGQLCQFIEEQDCLENKTIGVELRPENNSRFIIGGPRISVFQGVQSGNPDQFFTAPPNNASTLASLDPTLFPLSTVRVLSGSVYIDDTIIPYFGLDNFGNLIVPNNDGSVYLPAGKLNASLSVLRIYRDYLLITLDEMSAALEGYDVWHGWIHGVGTETWFYSILVDVNIIPQGPGGVRVAANGNVVIRDMKNPHFFKHFEAEFDTVFIDKDLRVIHKWVESYARDYLGKRFAVRVPFTCCNYDSETNRIRMSDHPTNEGGWTEMTSVIGLANLPGQYLEPLGKFRDELNRIKPFVVFTGAAAAGLNGLSKDDYFTYGEVDGGTFSAGPPLSGTGGFVYTDTLNGQIWVKDPTYYTLLGGFNQWIPLADYNGVKIGQGSPPGSLAQVRMIYFDQTSRSYYMATAYSVGGGGQMTGITWVDMFFYLYMKAEVQEDYVFHIKANCYAPRVVVELPQPIHMKTLDNTYEVTGAGFSSILYDKFYQGTYFMSPAAVAIPIKSSTITYGPWHNPSISANCEVVVDDTLSPWNFNGFTGLNVAGNLLANEARSNMLFVEMGSITVVGFPYIPLGAEINSSRGLHDYVETRFSVLDTVSGTNFTSSIVTYNFQYLNYADAWDGTFGPNITGVTINIGDDGKVTTTYNMRSFTPRAYGLSKWLVERIRSISTLNRSVNADIRNVKKIRAASYGYEI